MSGTWEDVQVMKDKRKSLREKYQKRKKERQDILNVSTLALASGENSVLSEPPNDEIIKSSEEIEHLLLKYLSDMKFILPFTSWQILPIITKRSCSIPPISHSGLCRILQKLSLQELLSISSVTNEGELGIEITSVKQEILLDMVHKMKHNTSSVNSVTDERKLDDSSKRTDSSLHKQTTDISDATAENNSVPKKFKEDANINVNEVLSLIRTPSIREKEVKKLGEEILDLLSKPTVIERSLTEKFRSQGGTQLTEFCVYRTRNDCLSEGNADCKKLHFKKIIASHTEENLGDCSYLNTCFHINTCKYVHYEVDKSGIVSEITETSDSTQNLLSTSALEHERTILYPPQWIQCDLRYFDTSVLGKFAVVMADPPWDIHMELPYGTLSDDEMRRLGVPDLQDNGLLFLWVTGRALELGRECLTLWGYEYVDELIWVKTNQLQRIIRTGRTGHWLNHGKEHCLVGMKGSPQNLNRGLDCDVIVAEVRDTSHKPDEIYGIIERLSPGTRKIELFGRSHNVQPNWITLGNQLQGVRLIDPDIISTFKKRYPDGNCLAPCNLSFE